jgi:hypothetical protein
MLLASLLFSLSAASPVSSVSAFGRDVEISAPVEGRVVAVLGNVRIDSRVAGDVIVWGGDVTFGPAGSVLGNLSVFGGELRPPANRSVPVRGTVSTPGTLLRLYLEELHRAPWQSRTRFAISTGLRLIGLAVWLGVSLVLLYLLGSPFARAAASAEEDWSGSLAAGALAVVTLFLAAAAALALLPAALSIPLALAAAAAGVAAKVFGMGALFLLLGQKLTRSVSPDRRPAALATGFAALAAVSLLPWVGGVIWAVASVVAVGIAVASRFGTPRLRVRLAA